MDLSGISSKIEMLDIDSLHASEFNSRTHSKDQLKKLVSSFKEYGFVSPILVDGDLTIIAGHGRVLAASLAGLTSVPCIRVDWLSDVQRRAYMLADNKLALDAGWDLDRLELEFGHFSKMGFDISLTGFTDREVAISSSRAELQDSEDPDHSECGSARIQFGDIWQVGAHRVMCGDSTDPLSVALLLDDSVPNLMVTDPPYGVDYDPSYRTLVGLQRASAHMGKVVNDNRCDWSAAYTLFPGNVAYVWCASGPNLVVTFHEIEDAGFSPLYGIVWNKSQMVMGRGDYHYKHEFCWYCVRSGSEHYWNGSRKETSVWDIAKEEFKFTHSTQKPLECMARPIRNNSVIGGGVYDPFLGSGTTLDACEKLSRVGFGMELSPSYCDQAIMRLEASAMTDAVLLWRDGLSL